MAENGAVAVAVAGAVAVAENEIWEERLKEVRAAFPDVLDFTSKHAGHPHDLQLLESQGYEWERHIRPGLFAYLTLHRSRMPAGSVTRLKSFRHPGIKEHVEATRQELEAMEMARTSGRARAIAKLASGEWRPDMSDWPERWNPPPTEAEIEAARNVPRNTLPTTH